MRPLSLQFCFSRQCISGDLANTSKKRAGAYVHGRKGDEGKDRMVGRGFWLWGDKGHRQKMDEAGKPRYFSIFTFCSGPSKSTSTSPNSPETNWREISTGRKSKQRGLLSARCSWECACCRGALWEEDVLGAGSHSLPQTGREGCFCCCLMIPLLQRSVLRISEEWPGSQASCILPALGNWLSHFPPVWPWGRVYDLSVSQFPPL